MGDMVGGQWRWRLLMLLTIPVLFGVLGMHALVAPPAPPGQVGPETGIAVSGPATAPHAAQEGTQHQSRGGTHTEHDGLPHLLHLCLAVLSVAGLAALATQSWLTRLPPPTPAARPSRPGGRRPVQRPPPVSRRLAQLCVMRT
ncbi:hypothetical protein FHS23_001850 [Prauserella isguenensis]|uniref:Uncharacterized protein n=2 Tax=Prauserella isguenensis TaxID=1470180 RepID=A0A839S288_9PSEU|nr:hypothetical protein [Prauserella isguenensis]